MAKQPSRGGKKASKQQLPWSMSGKPARSQIWTAAAVLSGVVLLLLLAASYLLFPHELPAMRQRLLGLACAVLAVLVYVFATHQPEPDDLMQRLQRGQHVDFGRQLRAARKRRRTVKLPLVGETRVRAITGTAIFVAVVAWWLTPWAPVTVKVEEIKDLAVPLGQDLLAVVLVLPDADLATVHPPVIPPRLREMAKRIPDDAGPYQLGLKALVQSRFDDARASFKAALKVPGTETAKIHMVRGQTELYACQFAAAVKWYRNALEQKPDDPVILGQAAVAWMQAGNYEKAAPLAARALEICREQGPTKDASLAAGLHVQAAIHTVRSEQFDEAEKLNSAAQDIWDEALGKRHSSAPGSLNNSVAASLNNKAVLYQLRANYHTARAVNILAYNAWAENLPAGHPYLAASRGNLAMLEYAEGRYAEARRLLDEVNKTLPNSLPSYHPAIAIALSQTALLQLAQAETKEGLPRAQKALTAIADRLGADHPSLLATLNTVAGFHASVAHYRKADHFQLRAVDTSARVLGPEHPYLATSLNRLATIYLVLKPLDQAEERGTLALAISQKAFGDKHPAVARDLRLLGMVEFRKNDPQKNPRTFLTQALEIEQKTLDKKHPEIALTLGALAALDTSPRTYKTSGVKRFEQAIRMDEELLGKNHPQVARLLFGLARLHHQRANEVEAEKALKRCLAIREKVLVSFHPELAATLELYAEVLRGINPSANAKKADEMEARAKRILAKHVEMDLPEVPGE